MFYKNNITGEEWETDEVEEPLTEEEMKEAEDRRDSDEWDYLNAIGAV